MQQLSRSVVLVDLDGTLTDPAEGIIGCFRHALEALGVFAPPAVELGWIIGPPLRQSFWHVSEGKVDPEEAVRMYRARYGVDGLFRAAVYEGPRRPRPETARRRRSGRGTCEPPLPDRPCPPKHARTT